MFHLRKWIAFLCLLLVAWTFVAFGEAPRVLLYTLPVIEILLAAASAATALLRGASEPDSRRLDPSLFSLFLRAPPQL